MSLFVIFLLMAVSVFLDQISKYLVVIYMDLYQSVDVIPGILRFTYIQNDGAAFGSMDDARWVFMLLSTVMIIAIVAYIVVKRPKDKLMIASLILITSGGIGNMIDRVRLGYVIDFIDFCAFPKIWMWVFNIADACVCVGAGMMILYLVLDMIREYKREKNAAAIADVGKPKTDKVSEDRNGSTSDSEGGQDAE